MNRPHYGWVIVAAAVGILTVSALAFLSFGIFLRPLTIEFGWDRGELSAAYSVTLLLGGALGILTGKLSDRYGPRLPATLCGLLIGVSMLLMSQVSSLWQAFLIWGLPMSIALSCGLVPLTTTVPRWFAKRRGMAMGITHLGIGLGGVIAPLLSQWLISSHSWQQAYVILGLLNLLIITPLAQLVKHSPQRAGLKPYGEDGITEEKQSLPPVAEGLSFINAFKTANYWLFGLIMFCFLFSAHVILIHIVPHAIDIGIGAGVAASIAAAYALTGLAGKYLVGSISDKIGIRRALSACLSIVTLTMIWLFFSGDIWMFFLFAVVFGISYGGVGPLEALLTGELFGLKSLGVIYASLLIFGTAGGAVGGPLAGYIYDTTKSYSSAFIICAVLCGLAFIFSLVILRSRRAVTVTKLDARTP